ncbi:MAG: FAD-dependent oxidoreductase, partial [Pseudomonadota bacterium]
MTQPFRVKNRGTLARTRTVRFTFDGKSYQGLEGDTLASALLANGVHLMGRSFKYHRPRGVMAAGVEEPNALMGISREGSNSSARHQPNVRASVQEIFEGLVATSQNRFPSLSFDVGAINSLMSPFFPAGFYYKTFKWPAKAWDKLYEPIIRRAAGLGESPTEPDPDRYTNRFAHCDVLVIGGGAAGLMAARTAADQGKSVILCDENPSFGGWLLSDTDAMIDGETAADWVAAQIKALRASPN